MKKYISFLFVALLFASSSSYAFNFIKLGTGHDVDFWANPNYSGLGIQSALEYLAARDKNQTNPVGSLEVSDQDVQDALGGDYGPFDALLFSESIQELSPDTYQLINEYVSAGGCVVVSGSHEQEQDFLNSAFGYNIGIMDVGNLTPFSIRPGAAGTAFAGGPPTLIAADATQVYSNTPGNTIYSGAEGVVVFADQVGDGNVAAIGWDYCCEPPDTADPIEAWYEVMNRAFENCGPQEPRVIPALSEWGLIAMAGVLGIVGLIAIRKRRVAA